MGGNALTLSDIRTTLQNFTMITHSPIYLRMTLLFIESNFDRKLVSWVLHSSSLRASHLTSAKDHISPLASFIYCLTSSVPVHACSLRVSVTLVESFSSQG